MTGSMLLIPEYALQVLPTLAARIGLNEAIMLQQLHYWTLRSKNQADGHLWVYNTTTEWAEQFPFWSESTIKRVIASLREQDLIVVRKSPHNAMDRTNWYRVNYDRVPTDDASAQLEPIVGSERSDGRVQPEPVSKRTETSTEITSETGAGAQPEQPPVGDVLFPDDPAPPRRAEEAMAQEAAALVLLEQVRKTRAPRSKVPTLEAVEKVADRYPDLDMSVVARELEFWAIHGNGSGKQIKTVMGTFATFARKAQEDVDKRRASQPPGQRVASPGEASQQQGWERPDWT